MPSGVFAAPPLVHVVEDPGPHTCPTLSGTPTESIYVGVRLRPLNGDAEAGDHSCWSAGLDGRTLSFTDAVTERNRHLPMHYAFDRVFGEGASNEQVYEETARPLVLSAMQASRPPPPTAALFGLPLVLPHCLPCPLTLWPHTRA